jgi:hypothetical protein
MCHINILSKLDFSRWSAVQFGLKKNVKNTGIPVFTGILLAVYRYSVFAISIHSNMRVNEKVQFANGVSGKLWLLPSRCATLSARTLEY